MTINTEATKIIFDEEKISMVQWFSEGRVVITVDGQDLHFTDDLYEDVVRQFRDTRWAK